MLDLPISSPSSSSSSSPRRIATHRRNGERTFSGSESAAVPRGNESYLLFLICVLCCVLLSAISPYIITAFSLFFINLSGPPLHLSCSLTSARRDHDSSRPDAVCRRRCRRICCCCFCCCTNCCTQDTQACLPLLSISSIGRRRKLVNVQCISFRLLLLRLCCLSTVEEQQQKSHLKGIILITTTILITLIITPTIISSPCPCSSTRGPPPR